MNGYENVLLKCNRENAPGILGRESLTAKCDRAALTMGVVAWCKAICIVICNI